MIKFGVESPVECHCGQPALRRTVETSYGMVSYDTHSGGMDAEHLAALGRLDQFHILIRALFKELEATPAEARKLTYGSIVEFDLASVKPSACDIRTHFVPSAIVRAFGINREIKLDAREDFDSPSILAELIEKGNEAVTILKAIHDNGDY